VREELYPVEVSSRFTALENPDAKVDIGELLQTILNFQQK
jgi:hypothetical protein